MSSLIRSLLGTLSLAIVAGGPPQDPAVADRAAQATSFVKRFMQGEFESLLEEMSETMRRAMSPAAAEPIRAALLDRYGPVKSIGEARHEDTIQGHERYRVAMELEREPIDLRIVFDPEGRVAGLFHVPAEQVERSDESSDEPARETLDPAVFAGHWEGAVRLPTGELGIRVDLAHDEGRWSGSVDIPAQGAAGLALAGVRVNGTAITFAIAGVPGDPTLRGQLAGGAIEGTFTQGPQSFPFGLSRQALASPARPQLPQPPFPYGTREVTFTNGDVTLAGTLTWPEGAGPHPGVVLVSGSGSQNRDEEIFDHRPFLVLADHLTRAGIAVLRYDDRGVGASTGSARGATTADLAGDAFAGLQWLRTRPEVRRERVGLLGHSEGGLIAAMLAAEHQEVAFVVMLAGPGVSGDKLLPLQLERILRANGIEQEASVSIRAEQEKLLALVRDGAASAAVREQYRGLIAAEHRATPGAETLSEEALDERVEQNLDVDTPWFRSFLVLDPASFLARTEVPVLALFGELDLQVPPEQNLPAVRAALEGAGHGDFVVEQLPGLNHLFQTAVTGSPSEYYTIEETMAPSALEKIRSWILAHSVPKVEGR